MRETDSSFPDSGSSEATQQRVWWRAELISISLEGLGICCLIFCHFNGCSVFLLKQGSREQTVWEKHSLLGFEM